MAASSDACKLAEYAEAVLPLGSAKLSETYFYQSLPLCVLDSVFSIGANYAGTREVVVRYCKWGNLQRIRVSDSWPSQSDQESISAFCQRPQQSNYAKMATAIYQNRQRTSTRNGILKAEAAVLFARTLTSFGVECFQDIEKVISNSKFEEAIRSIPGQRSGISLSYFWMLSGSDNFVKPDRMVLRFIAKAIGKSLSLAETTETLRDATKQLSGTFPKLTPRLLDHEIWKYQRSNA